LTQTTDDELTWTEIGTVPETVAPVLGNVMTAACVVVGAAVGMDVGVGVGAEVEEDVGAAVGVGVPVT